MLFDINEILKKVPHDGQYHTLKISVRREGFGAIIGSLCLDGERIIGEKIK